MTQQIKLPIAKPDKLRSISRKHMLGEKNLIPLTLVSDFHSCTHVHAYTLQISHYFLKIKHALTKWCTKLCYTKYCNPEQCLGHNKVKTEVEYNSSCKEQSCKN